MQVHDVADYITWQVSRPDFYIHDILPKEGVMLVYGPPKVKKSWFTQYMGFCVAQGIPFLGFGVEQTRVVLAQFEIPPRSYQWRLKDMGVNFQLETGYLWEVSPMLLYLEDEHNFNRFASAIRPLHPKIIVLDCMAACFGGDENDGADVADFIGKISRLKQEHEASIVLVHHTNKNMTNGGGSSVDKARGHSRLAGWVDTLVYMAEMPSRPGVVQLQIKARQATRDIPNIQVKFENYMWEVV